MLAWFPFNRVHDLPYEMPAEAPHLPILQRNVQFWRSDGCGIEIWRGIGEADPNLPGLCADVNGDGSSSARIPVIQDVREHFLDSQPKREQRIIIGTSLATRLFDHAE